MAVASLGPLDLDWCRVTPLGWWKRIERHEEVWGLGEPSRLFVQFPNVGSEATDMPPKLLVVCPLIAEYEVSKPIDLVLWSYR